MKVQTVTALTADIKKNLEGKFSFVCVQGEVSNGKLQASGHLYFTLKDTQSQISCVLFKGQQKTASLPSQQRSLKDGDKIVVQGEITVYSPRGNYQIIVKSFDFTGKGDLLQQLHALKLKMISEGLFDKNKKKELPKSPSTIGVVTSPTGAVIQDIIHVLRRRLRGFHLVLFPVKVQGEGAAEEIAYAIDTMNTFKLCDVLIVGRGGGSLEDLWPFNSEVVVRAIARSSIPTISAVGHETDVCLADFAADLRAPTPSAAAEICSAEKQSHIAFMQKASNQIFQASRMQLQSRRKQLQTLLKQPLLLSPKSMLYARMQELDDKKELLVSLSALVFEKRKLALSAKEKQARLLQPYNQIHSSKEKIAYFQKSLQSLLYIFLRNETSRIKKHGDLALVHKKIYYDIQTRKKRLKALQEHLESVNPKNLLKKGYCILFSEKKDSVILSTQDISQQDRLRIMMSDGQIHVTVEAKS